MHVKYICNICPRTVDGAGCGRGAESGRGGATAAAPMGAPAEAAAASRGAPSANGALSSSGLTFVKKWKKLFAFTDETWKVETCLELCIEIICNYIWIMETNCIV